MSLLLPILVAFVASGALTSGTQSSTSTSGVLPRNSFDIALQSTSPIIKTMVLQSKLSDTDLDDNALINILLQADYTAMGWILNHHATASYLARRLMHVGDVQMSEAVLKTMANASDVSSVAAYLSVFLQDQIEELEDQNDHDDKDDLARYRVLVLIAERYCRKIVFKNVPKELVALLKKSENQQPSESSEAVAGATSLEFEPELPLSDEQIRQVREYAFQHLDLLRKNTDLLLQLFRAGLRFELDDVLKRNLTAADLKLMLPYVTNLKYGMRYNLLKLLHNRRHDLVREVFDNLRFRYEFNCYEEYDFMVSSLERAFAGKRFDEFQLLVSLPGGSHWIKGYTEQTSGLKISPQAKSAEK